MGEWSKDTMEGKGSYTWADGRTYQGDWHADMKHGKGTLVWPEEKTYQGEWVEDKMTGQGICVWKNGKKYDGEWKNGKFHNRGLFTGSDGKETLAIWEDGQKKKSLDKLLKVGRMIRETEGGSESKRRNIESFQLSHSELTNASSLKSPKSRTNNSDQF